MTMNNKEELINIFNNTENKEENTGEDIQSLCSNDDFEKLDNIDKSVINRIYWGLY